ncbi:baseplate J/gp47 family protein [Lysinibacillus sp. NPDC097162]|uniref:baseplate J/gp47 family protein n=1 Tax=Lysinibacillus sp. NPDC097162 TaxID=3364140 RepID=UPI00381777EF
MAITPQFTNETEEAILARMLTAMRDDVGKRQGDIAYDLSDPVAQELAQAYIALDQTLGYAFLNEDMPSDLLTLAASDFGVDRKPSVIAKGEVTLTGPQGQLVPKSTQVRTDDGIYFQTINDVTLTSGTAKTSVEAVVGGTDGNVDIGEINTVVGDLAGVLTVTNELAYDTGVDEESDESLLQRVYDKVRKPATSGNVYHYEQWAREVSGVGAARVYPIWNGPGTVKVVLLGDDKRAPSQPVIDAAYAHINAERPVGPGDGLTVNGATEVPININASLTLASGAIIDEVKADIEKGVHAYLDSLAFKDNLIRYTRIAAVLLDIPRVIDYANLTVNGGTSNIEITDEQVAVLGTVSVNAV